MAGCPTTSEICMSEKCILCPSPHTAIRSTKLSSGCKAGTPSPTLENAYSVLWFGPQKHLGANALSFQSCAKNQCGLHSVPLQGTQRSGGTNAILASDMSLVCLAVMLRYFLSANAPLRPPIWSARPSSLPQCRIGAAGREASTFVDEMLRQPMANNPMPPLEHDSPRRKEKLIGATTQAGDAGLPFQVSFGSEAEPGATIRCDDVVSCSENSW
ncbi:hypothetical protein X797_002612 [Metarhizium robertsii]|uniref:Uncharacterized protein n=1 Tax=Metarhizium robertsii TaxID=568076 RepID=A0A0A1V3U9_9HYPO|nr:hypothetical protein X797_002612 [Metarhizium robertsii]